MIDGCFLRCVGRLMGSIVKPEAVVQIDALKLHDQRYPRENIAYGVPYTSTFLIDKRGTVKARHGIDLAPEVRIIGEAVAAS